MSMWSELRERLRALFSRTREDRELDEELAFHLDMEAANNLRDGLSPQDSRRRAHLAFGGAEQVREEVRDARGVRGLERLAQDVRYGVRSLRRTPTFTGTAVLILALGIGMATAMATVYNAVVLRKLPVLDPDRIVTLWTFSDPTVELAINITEVEEVRRQSRRLRGVAAFNHYGTFTDPLMDGDRPLVMSAAMVTANFFDVLGARPALGRLLRPEDRDATSRVTVISYGAWQRQFSGDPDVLGRRLTTTLDQQSYAIVGVASPGLDYPTGVDYWLPIGPGDLPGVGFDVVARLTPDASPEAARSEFLSIVRQHDLQRHVSVHPTSAAVRTLPQAVLGDTRAVLIAIAGAVALLLLIVCVNVGNLLLLRATLRVREIMIRRALGASSGEVARLLFVESALLGIAGGALGLACAEMLLRVLPAFAPMRLPRIDLIHLAGTPVAVATGVTLLAVLFFGVFPALAAARGNLSSALRLDARSGSETRQRRRVRQSLVASQVALAVVMLAGAGLLVRSLQRLERIELGYDTEYLSIVQLSIPFTNYNSAAELFAMFGGLYARLREVPGATALTPIIRPPFVGANVWQARPVLEGQSAAEADANPAVPVEAGGPEYFRTFGIPILRGRGIIDSDRENAPNVMVVSAALARRLWPGQDPLGKRVRFAGGDTTRWRTVVGIAGDIRFRRLREPTETMFLPWRQLSTQGYFAMRSRAELASFLPDVRRAVRDFDPELDVWEARSMDDYLAGPLAQPRLSALLLSAFGVVALGVAAIGLYGVMASAVRERTRDLGVRMALGATPGRLVREVLSGGLVITAIGTAVGLGGTLVGSRLLAALLFEVSPTDPATLAGVCMLFFTVALVAAYLPARRATRVDPMQALRAE